MQYYIPFQYFTNLANQRTPWNLGSSSHQSIELAPILITPLTANQLPADMAYVTYCNLLDALRRLANLLQQIEGAAMTNSTLLGSKEGVLSQSAKLLKQSADQLNHHLSSAAANADADAHAKAQATLTLWSLVATGRHVDGNFSFSGQQEAVDQAINDVVRAAYALAQGTIHQEA